MTTAERRRVLITGASSGIGLEAAKILLARGDELTLLCRNADLNGIRQCRPGLIRALPIAAEKGQLISTGQKDLRCLKPDPAAGTGDQNAAPFSCRHGA